MRKQKKVQNEKKEISTQSLLSFNITSTGPFQRNECNGCNGREKTGSDGGVPFYVRSSPTTKLYKKKTKQKVKTLHFI